MKPASNTWHLLPLHEQCFSCSCKAPEVTKAMLEDIPGVPMENKRLKWPLMGVFVLTVVQFWLLVTPASRGAGGTSYSLTRELHFQSGQMHGPGGQGRWCWRWCSDYWQSRFSIFMIYWHCHLNVAFYCSRKYTVSVKFQLKAWLSCAFWISSFMS